MYVEGRLMHALPIAECSRRPNSDHDSLSDFRDELKTLHRLAGLKNTPTVLLLTDSDLVSDRFLEDINSLLNSGEVPDLLDHDEMDHIVMELKSECEEDSRDAVCRFFFQRVRTNLHLALTMSPAGSRFRQRCRNYPSLVNCCTIDWFDSWSPQACESVASSYFQPFDFIPSLNTNQEIKTLVAKACVEIHQDVVLRTDQFWSEMRRRHYVTPSSFMEFCRIFIQTLEDTKNKQLTSRARLLGGLAKLSEANVLVGTMQEELVALGPRIEAKQADTERLLAQLQKDRAAVDQVKVIVQQEEEAMIRETELVQQYSKECEQDLASVLPALQAAIQSLDALDKSDIAEIRTYAHPPVLVQSVMEAVCVLLQRKPDWLVAKQLLLDPNFLATLIQFDINNIPNKVITKLKKLTSHPDFNAEKVGSVSVACMSMCNWVLALEHYNTVYQMVGPKQRNVEDAKSALKLAEQNLARKQQSLQKITNHLDTLTTKYENSVAEREGLKQRKITTAQRLERASVLIAALVDEEVRWKSSVTELEARLRGIVGDSLVSGASIAYLGPFTGTYRHQMIEGWIKRCMALEVPISSPYDFVKDQSLPSEVMRWQNEGLPHDHHSTENAVMVIRTRRWPLLIDPQGQGQAWVRRAWGTALREVSAGDSGLMQVSGLNATRGSRPRYRTAFREVIERAIRAGEPVLLTGVGEELDPALRPVLEMELIARQNNLLIKIGDTEIEFNQKFRLFLATSLSNPHYLPAVCIQVTLVNFTVTFTGLQDQLLSEVVRNEEPELESKRQELLSSIAGDRDMLRILEDRSLELLQASEGHILDQQDLIQTLQGSKAKSAEVLERVSLSEETQKTLDAARLKYLSVATRGAVLYFVLADLSSVDIMYQFSLAWFRSVFTACIKQRDPSNLSLSLTRGRPSSGTLRPSSAAGRRPNPSVERGGGERGLERHLKAMIDRLTERLYQTVSVALFAEHQLTFSFMLTTSIMRHDTHAGLGTIAELEWSLFLQGDILAASVDASKLASFDGLTAAERQAERSGEAVSWSCPSWIDTDTWRRCQHLEMSLSQFTQLCRSLLFEHDFWEEFRKVGEPYEWLVRNTRPESGFDPASFSHWHRVLLINVLRKDSVTASCFQFVLDKLGPRFVTSGAFDLQTLHDSADCRTPLIFILSPGSDPTAPLLRFARESRGSAAHVDIISLGRGQGQKAEELVNKSIMLKARWVLLQNCHLAASWLPRLQALVERFKNLDVDPQFRLFLSSKPDPAFPISILQSGLKMTVEPPQGLRANLNRAFISVTDAKTFNNTKSFVWRSLLYGLCFFNALIHERKKFSSLGWNLIYEFNESDLEVSVRQLTQLVVGERCDWLALRHLTGEVTYGGRVTDDWDRRCLLTTLHTFFSSEALLPGYTYSNDGLYRPIEQGMDFQAVLDQIQALPTVDTPEVFGMDSNADTAFKQAQGFLLLHSLSGVEPRQSSGFYGLDKDQLVIDLTADLLSRLPEIEPVPVEGVSALDTILQQETARFERLLSAVRHSLRELELAVKGETVMSDSSEEVYNSLLSQKVPEAWKKVGYESCKTLSAWIRDLIDRVGFFAAWTQETPRSFWLSAFFFPQGFLTGVLQTQARKRLVSIDSLAFDFAILGEELAAPEDGVFVRGLYIDGARWDSVKETLEDSTPGQRFYPLPEIHFLPVKTDQVNSARTDYDCPLYRTSLRAGTLSSTGISTNFVTSVRLPSERDPQLWVTRGVALLCQPDLPTF